MALAMQSQKGNATTHLFQIAIGTAPVKPLTNLLRQLPPRNSGLFVDGCLNSIDNFRRKYLTTDIHAGNLINNSPCVQRKMWDMGSFIKGELDHAIQYPASSIEYHTSPLVPLF